MMLTPSVWRRHQAWHHYAGGILYKSKLAALLSLLYKITKDLQSAVLAVQSARAQYQITEAGSVPQVGSNTSVTRQANNRIDANSFNQLSCWACDEWL